MLDLFSGIGGISVGLERAGFQTVAFCEIDPYCREVLRERFHGVPVHDDIRTLSGEPFRGRVDIVAGGTPCQPVSVAGSRRGQEDHRWLWPEMLRVVREVRPDWVLAENVPGLRTLGADRVLEDLESEGYACWPCVVGADDVGAPHRRKRVWIVAHAHRRSLRELEQRVSWGRPGGVPDEGAPEPREHGLLADGDGRGRGRLVESLPPGLERSRRDVADGCRWPSRPGEPQYPWEPPRTTQPGLGRGADGLPDRLDSRLRRERLEALGNSVIPQVVEAIGYAILAAERQGGRRVTRPPVGCGCPPGDEC